MILTFLRFGTNSGDVLWGHHRDTMREIKRARGGHADLEGKDGAYVSGGDMGDWEDEKGVCLMKWKLQTILRLRRLLVKKVTKTHLTKLLLLSRTGVQYHLAGLRNLIRGMPSREFYLAEFVLPTIVSAYFSWVSINDL
ncbi:uncharacterized protein LOC141596630 [Silene latifolia]|uniref:uncharacterized protein LOC141596630 n=1 Tax=Silene latifolia TaxID=37657 RepID=UPI003D779536